MVRSNGLEGLRGEFVVQDGSLSLEAAPIAASSDLKPWADRAAPEGSKQSEERFSPTSLTREEYRKRKHRAGERGRRGALRQASRLWRHRCFFRPARGPLTKRDSRLR